ncbi:ABC transporter substrate-binding protein [Brevibacillus laterosporus]|uniref:ABC transporter substrate-binding protein n=1 Tax=Brevibacillus laterosporus TaxID=1465 RepID=UPI000E6C4B57|nr:ABC transporter substrate-binding protein [Brevibacillus laterosporus]AYB37771.1 helix-turn-helix domain-containing protein [Brevibacillus laterosporus]MBM7111298.1 HTH-type transcriptional activator Btr [Brevibacillus laterosporus]NKQ18930.1 ABC transporter substrate-binding protein [Brevibacillus laterosporus]WNX29487.1 ABC transporter substrate-binding protein [Brevibacillus laterosporus]
MTQLKSTCVPLRSLLFHLSTIEMIIKPVGWKSEIETSQYHTLFIFNKGKGTIHIDTDVFQLLPEKCYSLPPGSTLQIENGYDSEIQFYQITFTVIQIGESQHTSYSGNILPDKQEIAVYPFSRLNRLTEALYAGNNYDSELEWFKQHLHFQDLLGFLFEHNLHYNQSFHSTLSVENTIHYMKKNYMYNITVKQLAHLANVAPWKYTTIFQELTGKKPLDFLTELRINHSKELLIHSNSPLREIACQVGFSDEYYFNRRFRQMTGIAPKQYALLMRRGKAVKDWTGHEVKIPSHPKRIIYHGETYGDLLALGVKAVGGGYALMDHPIYKDRGIEVQDIGLPINPEKTMALKPDLIIFANADENEYKKISRIAPTVTFNSFAPLAERIQTLGRILDKRKEAKKWLDGYDTKATSMWQQLRSKIKPGETASVFIYEHGKHLYVMGTTGLSSALYHPLGFQPVPKIQEILDSGSGFIEISEEALPQYAGDRIFMLLSTNVESKQATDKLMDTPSWKNLPAVRDGYVYLIEAEIWNYADAMTREWLLESLPQLIV